MNKCIELINKKDFKGALKRLQGLIKRNNKDSTLFYYCGLIYFELKDFKNAKIYLEKAIKLNPSNLKMYRLLSNVYKELNDIKYLNCLNNIIELEPLDHNSYFESANIYLQDHNYLKALEFSKKAYELNQSNENYALQLAMIYQLVKKYEKTLNILESVLKINPNSQKANTYLGLYYSDIKDYTQAKYYLKKCLTLGVKDTKVYFTLGTIFLLQKEFLDGWKFYSYRDWKFNFSEKEKGSQFHKKALGFLESISIIKNYNGEELSNKTLYVTQEQGFGDSLMFAYFLTKLPSNCKVVFFVNKSLLKLMQSSFIDYENIEVVELFKYLDIKCDYKARLLDLLRFFVRDEKDALIKPYLKYKRDKKFIDETDKLKIGFSFKGSPGHSRDDERSFKIEEFIKILNFNDKVSYYCLEKFLDSSQKKYLEEKEINIVGEELIDFNDTANLINELDLVISVDTAIAHVGALSNTETWILIPFIPDWRWGENDHFSYWYGENTKLIREKNIEGFDDRINKTNAELNIWIKSNY